MTLHEAMKEDCPTLEQMSNLRSEPYAIVLIVKMLQFVSEMFNVGKNLTDTQITYTAEQILYQYGFLKIAEVKCCLNLAISGKFGGVYDRIDPPTILNWFTQYNEIRTVEAEKIQLNEAPKSEPVSSTAIPLSAMPVEFQESLKDLQMRFLSSPIPTQVREFKKEEPILTGKYEQKDASFYEQRKRLIAEQYERMKQIEAVNTPLSKSSEQRD